MIQLDIQLIVNIISLIRLWSSKGVIGGYNVQCHFVENHDVTATMALPMALPEVLPYCEITGRRVVSPSLSWRVVATIKVCQWSVDVSGLRRPRTTNFLGKFANTESQHRARRGIPSVDAAKRSSWGAGVQSHHGVWGNYYHGLSEI